MRLFAAMFVAVALAAAAPSMQAPARHVTSAHTLSKYGHFFHGAHVSFLGTVATAGGVPVVALGEKQRAAVIWQQPESPAGRGVLRGLFLDLGRLEPADPRLSHLDTQKILDALNEGRWPGRGLIFLLTGAAWDAYEPPAHPDLRAIVLDPARHAGSTVTVSGRFRGRNLLGDQPVSPGRSPHEYVLRVADAAIWVSGLRPRGRGFTLDPDARRDTREWVRVTGVVRHEPPLVWIEGKAIELARPGTETLPAPEPLPQGPPPEIVFSAPLDGETGVPAGIVLRVQFSRDIDPASLENQIAVAYGMRADGSAPETPPAAATRYLAANRAVEIRFAQPLAPFTPVFVAFGNGIRATDGAVMKPVRISFVTGR